MEGNKRLRRWKKSIFSSISLTDFDSEEAGNEIFVLDEDESEDKATFSIFIMYMGLTVI